MILLAIICLLTSSPAWSNDVLWQRAVAISAYNRDRVPGKWIEREEVFNVEGESHLITQTHVAFSQIGNNIDVRLVSAKSNGIDITAQINEVFEERRSAFSLKPQYNPFLPTNQNGVTAKPNGRSRRDGETNLIAYDYTQKSDEGRWRGIAWIDETTGMPTELTARLTGLPTMDDKDKIRKIILNVIFTSGEEQEWQPSKVTLFTGATLNNFPYRDFYATIEKSIRLEDYWKIIFN